MQTLLSILFLILVLVVNGGSNTTPISQLPTPPPIDHATPLARIFEQHDGVVSVESVSVGQDGTGWLVYAEATLVDGWNSLYMAKELQQLALTLLVSARVDFSVILTDTEHGAIDYSRWTYRDNWIVTPLTTIGNG